jgi:transglutaminase-like putative cysteine protease
VRSEEYLRPTSYIDADAPAVVAFASDAVGDARSDSERAIRLFYAVRDGIRYTPYGLGLVAEAFKASAVLEEKSGFCVQKAIVLCAAARSVGVAARLGFADVRNHLCTERLRALMRTDVFAFHGFTELFLGGRWVKATPTFNQSLCERFGVLPLDFDGEHDAIFHPFDTAGKRHMEYLRYHGTFADFPLQRMVSVFRETYPHFFGDGFQPLPGGDFDAEATAERERLEKNRPPD